MSLAVPLFRGIVCCALLCAFNSAQVKPAADAGASDYQRGMAGFERGDLVAAREGFDKAVQANPKSADAQSMLAQVQLRQGQVEAIVHFRKLVELRPKLAMAHIHLGRAFEMQSNFDSAVAVLRQSVELAPADSETHRELGRVLSLQKKTADAISKLNTALRLAPGHAEFAWWRHTNL